MKPERQQWASWTILQIAASATSRVRVLNSPVRPEKGSQKPWDISQRTKSYHHQLMAKFSLCIISNSSWNSPKSNSCMTCAFTSTHVGTASCIVPFRKDFADSGIYEWHKKTTKQAIETSHAPTKSLSPDHKSTRCEHDKSHIIAEHQEQHEPCLEPTHLMFPHNKESHLKMCPQKVWNWPIAAQKSWWCLVYSQVLTRIVCNSSSDENCGLSLSPCRDDDALLLFAGLLNNILGALCILLCDLLRFDCCRELRAEGQMCLHSRQEHDKRRSMSVTFSQNIVCLRTSKYENAQCVFSPSRKSAVHIYYNFPQRSS